MNNNNNKIEANNKAFSSGATKRITTSRIPRQQLKQATAKITPTTMRTTMSTVIIIITIL